NPNANGTVHALAIGAGGLVYAGGEFFMIGGMGRNHIAALDPIFNQNQATAWDPAPNDNVDALAVAGNTVFAGGDFTSLGGPLRNRIVAIDAAGTGPLLPWDPGSNGNVTAFAISG